jgi:hypothetical protein
MSIDPKIFETSQPYVFTNDNPLNEEDPLGLAGVGVFLQKQLCGKKGCTSGSLLDVLGEAGSFALKHVGDIATVGAIGVCIAYSFGACAFVSAAALGARVTQRYEEGVPIRSSSNALDALITSASLGLLGGPASIGLKAFAGSGGSIVFRIYVALPDIIGWTAGFVSHKNLP